MVHARLAYCTIPQVKVHEPGYKVIEVEQCGELRVLWISRIFRTYLDVTEDARDPECLKTDFKLLRSVSNNAMRVASVNVIVRIVCKRTRLACCFLLTSDACYLSPYQHSSNAMHFRHNAL